ncbi:MAG: DUF2807 domain-containing protein [Chitinophagales bacterium]|nr:DUF2807 domain-containing protein [Chitinophagales bacterium]
MKKFYLPILILSALFIFSCDSENTSMAMGSSIRGEGDVNKRTINMEHFSSIQLSSHANVYLQKGPLKVEVEGQDNIIDQLNTDVVSRTWNIRFKKSIRNAKGLNIYISMPELENISLSGSGNIKGASTFDGSDEMELKISGSGNLSLALKAEEVEATIHGSGDMDLEVEAEEVEAKISGSGDIDLSGSADEFEGHISGSGDIDAKSFQSKEADISISGSGSCTIGVSGELNSSISGSGDVRYYGNPSVNSKGHGSGKVKNAGN